MRVHAVTMMGALLWRSYRTVAQRRVAAVGLHCCDVIRLLSINARLVLTCMEADLAHAYWPGWAGGRAARLISYDLIWTSKKPKQFEMRMKMYASEQIMHYAEYN